MTIKIRTKKQIIGMTLIILLFPAVSLFGQDFETQVSDGLIASAKISPDSMSISYHGRAPGVSEYADNQQLIPQAGLNDDKVLPHDELVWVGEKLKTITQHVLRYVFFDKEDPDNLSPWMMKNKIETRTYPKDKLDVDFAVNVGVDDKTKDVSVNAVKVSSYGFLTHLDAVYDYKTDSVDLIFSNLLLNDMLLEGMQLEFQVNPKKSSTAVMFNIKF